MSGPVLLVTLDGGCVCSYMEACTEMADVQQSVRVATTWQGLPLDKHFDRAEQLSRCCIQGELFAWLVPGYRYRSFCAKNTFC